MGADGFGQLQIISVNRAGSVPPAAADILSGATLTTNAANQLQFDGITPTFWQGVTFVYAGTQNILLSTFRSKTTYFKNCTFTLTGSGSAVMIANSTPTRIVFDNTTVAFGNAAQKFNAKNPMELIWLNTASAIQGATIPTTLFNLTGTDAMTVTCRGVDLSAITGTLLSTNSIGDYCKVLLDSCRIASGVTRYGTPASGWNDADEIELVNCYDGTNVVNERYTISGAVTTDRSTTLSGGAEDNIGNYSLKLVSSTRSSLQTLPLDTFWLDVGNSATGSSKTAKVEVISSASLNNTDIKLLLEYMGTSGASTASFVESLSSVLAASSALPSSSATWINPPATPIKQYLQVTFTPQRAGRVRGLVRLGKTSTTVWIDPRITIT